MGVNFINKICVKILAGAPSLGLLRIKKAGGKVVRFTRNPHEDDHASETALEDHDDFDCVLDNANMSVDETNRALLAQLKEWEWLNAKI